MEPKDRRFAEIASRLQLLTQDQLVACAKHMRARKGLGIAEAAVELGLLSNEQADRVRSHEARLLERQREHTRKLAGAAVEERTQKVDLRSAASVVEERVKKVDPRSASAPPRTERRAGAHGRSIRPTQKLPAVAPFPGEPRKPAQTWQAPARREDGQVMVPRTPGEQNVSERFHEVPTAKVSMAALAAASESKLEKGSAPLPVAAPKQTPVQAPVQAPMQDGAWFDLVDAQGAEAVKPSASQSQLLARAPAPRPSQQLPSPMLEPGPMLAPAVELTPPSKRAATVAPASSYLGRALALALRQGASDLHAHSGAPLLIRVDGQLRPLSGNDPLSASAAEKVIAEVMNDAQKAQLAAKGEIDFACEMPGLGRMRVNVYRQQRGLDAVFRLVPKDAPTLEQLSLPARLARLTEYRTGMVLCTGPAGCGKSTTLAALIGGLVGSRSDHILSIEDPVEFVYPPGKALVNQRQVRDHTSSFARALRAALREDPDIIVITELRDRDTISLAISAAETGHLVLGTLHTGSAAQTIARIVSSFSADEQEQMRVMLAESLRAVVSQRLVPKAKGPGRVPALEILMVNTAVSNLIRDDKAHQLPSVMQTGKAAGMITLDDSLDELLRAGTITIESARRFAVKKDRFP